MLEQYNRSLLTWLTRQQTRFYLLAASETPPILDAVAQACICYLQDENGPYLLGRAPLELILMQPSHCQQPTQTQAWLSLTNFHLHHHIRHQQAVDYQRLLRFWRQVPVGVVLGGGGVRAFAHLGAINALIEQGIPIDAIGGTSSGAGVAAYYARHPYALLNIELMQRAVSAFKRALSWRNITWPVVSLLSGSPITEFFDDLFLDIHIEDLWLPFFCVSANIQQDVEHVYRSGLVSQALCASSALPGLMPPRVISGQLHYDGALVNNLPVDNMRSLMGERAKVIAISLVNVNERLEVSRHYSFPPILSLRELILYRLGVGHRKFKFPRFFEIFFKALLVASWQRERQNEQRADIMVKPNLSEYGLYGLSSHQEQMLYHLGYEEARHALRVAGWFC